MHKQLNVSLHLCKMELKVSLLLLLVMNGVFGDSVLKEIQLTPELYSKMKKVWYIFVKTFIGDKVLQQTTSFNSFKKTQSQLLHLSGRFVQLIDRNVAAGFNKSNPVHFQTVKWAFGKINFNFNSPSFRVHFNLTFQMYYRYQLNLTFYDVFFSSNICYLGALSIIPSWYKGYYEFCGYHSLFNFYPQASSVKIKCISREGESVSLNIGFTVFDHDIVSSVTENSFYSESILPATFHKFKPSVTLRFLEIYFIKTKVTSQIKLNFMLNVNVQYLLHDGPSLNFHARRITRSKYVTSTHQCKLQILHGSYLHNVENKSGKFSYTSKPLNFLFVQLHEYSLNDSVSLPMELCQQSHCLIKVQSQSNNLQVNITVSKITSEITHNPKCIYGGLVIGEQMYDNQQEYQTLCESHDGSKTLSKSTYSSNFSLFIALYWYNSTGRIITSLNISQTPCKPLYIDDCRIVTFYSREKNQSRCMSYLKKITAHTDVHFKKCCEKFWISHSCDLHLSSKKRTSCTIVQYIRKEIVTKSSLVEWPKKCITTLAIDLFSDYFIEGKYTFKKSFGLLPSSWILDLHHDRMSLCNSHGNIIGTIVEEFWGRDPIFTMYIFEIYRQRHSWIEMILNTSDASCVLQLINIEPLLFYSLNNTLTDTKCPDQTLIMRILEHKNISLDISIKAYQGLKLSNPKKEMMYWVHDNHNIQNIIEGTFLYWRSIIFHPKSYTVISLPGKIYSFKINIWKKRFNELIQKLTYDFSNDVNKLDSTLLDFIWLDEAPTIMSQFDLQSEICRDTPRNLTFSQCLNFSQMTNLHKEYYIFSWTTSNPSLRTSILKSWNEASSLCESIKGQLPYFTSSDELNEIIKVLRLTSEIPPLMAIFIGLWFNKKKVCALISETGF